MDTAGDMIKKVIERSTTIPTKKGHTFPTHADNQPGVLILILTKGGEWSLVVRLIAERFQDCGERDIMTYNAAVSAGEKGGECL